MLQMTKKFVLTKQGLEHLKNKYEELINSKRPAIAQRINRAREFGDLAENSEYDAAKDEQSLLESRISELEKVLHKAQIVQESRTDFVVIGSTVLVEIDGEKDKFTIVGTMEANPAERKISDESPVGQALLSAKVGEVVEVNTSIIKAKYKILEIK